MANILSQLSSQSNDRSESSNERVAVRCLAEPDLLKEIASGLAENDVLLIGDCAEVMTKVAEANPQLVRPYATQLIPLLQHKNTRVRWEATHAVALIAQYIPTEIVPITKQLQEMALNDKSTIVRDYSIIALGNYALTSKQAAQESLEALALVLNTWKEKQAHRVFKGFRNCVVADHTLVDRVNQLIEPYADSEKGTVKKAYKDLLKVL